jgi:hypothetical protein
MVTSPSSVLGQPDQSLADDDAAGTQHLAQLALAQFGRRGQAMGQNGLGDTGGDVLGE